MRRHWSIERQFEAIRTENTINLYKRLKNRKIVLRYYYVHEGQLVPIKEGEYLKEVPSPRGLRNIYRKVAEMPEKDIDNRGATPDYIGGALVIFQCTEGYDGKF